MYQYPLNTGRELNVQTTFRRHRERLLSVLCTFNLRLVSREYLHKTHKSTKQKEPFTGVSYNRLPEKNYAIHGKIHAMGLFFSNIEALDKLLKKEFHRKCFPVTCAKSYRTGILKNNSQQLLLTRFYMIHRFFLVSIYRLQAVYSPIREACSQSCQTPHCIKPLNYEL